MARCPLVALLLLVLLAACTSPSDEVSPADLEVGDCFDDARRSESTPYTDDHQLILSVEVVPCRRSHDNEVYWRGEYPARNNEVFPGNEALQRFAEDKCLDAFELYVGKSYDASVLIYGSFKPSELSWEQDHRGVTCFLYNADLSALEGSMQDSQR